jgi:hypothetical protein
MGDYCRGLTAHVIHTEESGSYDFTSAQAASIRSEAWTEGSRASLRTQDRPYR